MSAHNAESPSEKWNAISTAYQRRRSLSTHAVSLGALVSDVFAAELLGDLLGDLQGKRVLDAGCGGGQTCIALARQGALVAGVDSSTAQLEYARTLAAQEGFAVPFHHSDITDLGALADGGWNLVLSIAVLHYLAEPAAAIRESARALAPGGHFLVSVDHPLRSLFYDHEEEEWSVVPMCDYLPASVAERGADWRYPDTQIALTTWHHTVEEWVSMIIDAGLRLTALHEPPTPDDLLDELWPEDDALAPLRHLPHTLILVAQKPLA